jgi:hypothetical protein
MEPIVQTDTTIPNNKSDIIIRENKNGTCILIYVISRHRNVIKPEAEKILQHEYLTTKVRRIWNVKQK